MKGAFLAVAALLLAACAGRPARDVRPCPEKPNCVSSLSRDPEDKVAPLLFEGEPAEAWERLKKALGAIPRLKIVEERPGYLHAVATSRLFRFKDDVQFVMDEAVGAIQVRSASRTGYSDMGVNRRRVERIRALFEGAGRSVAAPKE